MRSEIQIQKQIDKHLIPLSMKFVIENFVECKEEVGCEFDDICSLISSKKIKIENKEDLHRLSEDLENIVGYILSLIHI